MTLNIKDQQIQLDPFLIQTSKLGREFKLIGIKIDYETPPVFINKMYMHCTYYFFKYLDDNSYFGLYFDAYDKIKFKLTHQEVINLHTNNSEEYNNEKKPIKQKPTKKDLIIKKYYEDLKNPLWLKKRKEILTIDNLKCVICNSVNNLQVHHLLYKNNKRPWEYDNEDLITLCSKCHKSEHKNFGTGNFKRSLEYFNKSRQGITDHTNQTKLF